MKSIVRGAPRSGRPESDLRRLCYSLALLIGTGLVTLAGLAILHVIVMELIF